jgi:hypothetical protein
MRCRRGSAHAARARSPTHPQIKSLAFSAIIIVGALVLPLGTVGMIRAPASAFDCTIPIEDTPREAADRKSPSPNSSSAASVDPVAHWSASNGQTSAQQSATGPIKRLAFQAASEGPDEERKETSGRNSTRRCRSQTDAHPRRANRAQAGGRKSLSGEKPVSAHQERRKGSQAEA